MAPLLSFFLTLLMLTCAVCANRDVTSFQIDSFSPSSSVLTYQRDASFPPSPSGFLRLTGTDALGRPRPSSVGRVLYSTPVNFWEPGRQSSFETTIRFRISSVTNFNPADGLTFFIIPVNSTRPTGTGGQGGGLGIFDDALLANARVFAVEFDIYVNVEFDPGFRHIGINIDSKRSANVTRFDDAIGPTVTARINYDAPTRRIDVVANYNSRTATVSYVHDLKTILPQQVQVGISASVGPTQAAIFDVFSWYFTSSLVRTGINNGDVADEEDFIIKQTVM